MSAYRWRKSSRSFSNGNCVEVGQEEPAWRKSSRSAYNGSCVEVGTRAPVVAVRDSKDPGGPVVEFKAGTWMQFLDAIRDSTT